MSINHNSLQPSTSEVSAKENNPRSLVEKAMSTAAYLLNRFGNTPDFYRDIRTPVVERWMNESFPEVVQKLQAENSYEDFRNRLDAYLEVLFSAACSAEQIIEHGSCDALEDDSLGHRIFSGLASRIATSNIEVADEETLLVALLIDRFRLLGEGHDYSLRSVARHTEIWKPENLSSQCDIIKFKAASIDVAHVLSREHFPRGMLSYTSEEFALVINVPTTISPSSLVSPRHIQAVSLQTPNSQYELFVGLASCPFLIPLSANEEALSLFRNYLTVLYLQGDDAILVEYPWTPVTDFTAFMSENDYMDSPPDGDIIGPAPADFKAMHPDVIWISEIRSMPLLAGPQPAQRSRRPFSHPDDEPIPF
ncbi:hypothetical protein [Paraburkholderia sp. RL17-347-BIC-D]|uniref:hypothetical protein n=1 Tax=Paraburkholderia sp. RL17-347-BIC-D TaxID=3031632 RepID=UPI0038BC29CA